MLLYNVITELFGDQSLIVLILSSLVLCIVVYKTKKRVTLKDVFFASSLAVVLSLLSLSIGRGDRSGGEMYLERFGWPTQYFGVLRNISSPFSFERSFSLPKFIVNAAYWGLFSLSLIFIGKPLSHKKSRLSVFLVLIFILLSASGFSARNALGEEKMREIGKKMPVLEFKETDRMKDKQVMIYRENIESRYPEFKDFERQESMTGKSVEYKSENGNHYFAYVLHGSGFPVISATCFMVNSQNEVIKFAEFSPADNSLERYTTIDPVTCKAILKTNN